MSDVRIALVAEGPTDKVVIEAALKALLQRPFVLTLLHPEATRPDLGAGWGGVFKWCYEFRQRGAAGFEADPILGGFDLVIVHLDADVSHASYADYGAWMEQAASGLPPLPCAQKCPPPSDGVKALEAVLLAWLGIKEVGLKSLFCIPSMATEAWLCAAILPTRHSLFNGLECNHLLGARLAQLPKAQRMRKSVPEYQSVAAKVSAHWAQVKSLCTQAAAFEQKIKTWAQTLVM